MLPTAIGLSPPDFLLAAMRRAPQRWGVTTAGTAPLDIMLPEEESEDVDYSPSEAESEDSLEWASETERTIAEDALSEGKVGIDFYGAAMSVATEYVASYKPVQMGLRFASVIPVLSVQRAARAARRAGAKNIEIER